MGNAIILSMDLVRIRTILQEECQLTPDRPVLVGVSGGPDSLCLLDLLDLLGYPLVVAHVDHGLRPTSAEDAAFVQAQATQRQATFTTTRLDITAYARAEHLSIEEAARKARYRFLFEQAAAYQAQAVAVAHTADDQVETVLMHLLRGAGLSGLKGMLYRAPGREWGADLPLVRPLLSTWRAEVLAYCQERQLHPRLDETNADPAFFRNRLRLELIPILESYNPRIKLAVWRTAQALAGDHAVLEEALSQARQACRQQNHPNHVQFNLKSFAVLPTGQQRSLLRGAIAHLLPNLRDVDYQAVERALAFIRAPNTRQQMDFIKGLYLFIEDERLFVARWGVPILDDDWPWIQPAVTLGLPLPGTVNLGGGWIISAEPEPVNDISALLARMGERYECWLDADTLTPPLTVRASRPGERIQPLGMDDHSLRLSDYWVNKKLSKRARATWPLVWNGDMVAWVPGYQPGHPFRVTPATRRAVHLRIWNSEKR